MIQNYLHGVTRTSLKVTAKHGSRMKNSLQPDKTLSFMESSVGDLPLQFVKRVKSSLVHINETFIKCAMLNLGYSRQTKTYIA